MGGEGMPREGKEGRRRHGEEPGKAVWDESSPISC